MHEGLMATGLVKWWRARFLAGYRPFSVVGGNTEGSDSEELLGGVSAGCNGSPPEPRPILIESESAQLPAAAVAAAAAAAAEPSTTTTTTTTATPVTGNDEQQTTTTTASATKQLSFEEFECDVSVAEGDRRRQEFSFTLYDFDGHGKITKDDIAGLVTTIYDTLGASIQVPPCGSKTIKVKLTVSPDQRSGGQTRATATAVGATAATAAAATVAAVAPGGCPNPSQPPTSISGNSSCCHLKHATTCNNAATNHHPVHASRRIPRRRRAPRHRCQNEQKEVESHSEDEGENVRANRVKQEELRRRVGPLPHIPSPYSNSSEGDISDDSDISPVFSPLTPLLVTNQRKRSGALQRQQLLEIIQANMEKNNLSFHTSRKRHQNEQLRIPTQATTTTPTAAHADTTTTTTTSAGAGGGGGVGGVHYPTECRSPSESRTAAAAAAAAAVTASAYHKPTRENPHNFASFPKLAAKSRGNLRKSRAAGQYGMQRNNVVSSSTQSPRVQGIYPHQQQSPQTLTRNVISPPTTTYAEQPSGITGRNVVTGNLILNNQQQQQQQQQQQTLNQNNHNVQRNDNQFVAAQAQQCGKSSKKHQLKHATKEQDQARAMEQVVRWLEREFSQNAVAAAASGRKHVHEHIHHHYHHYHAEALV